MESAFDCCSESDWTSATGSNSWTASGWHSDSAKAMMSVSDSRPVLTLQSVTGLETATVKSFVFDLMKQIETGTLFASVLGLMSVIDSMSATAKGSASGSMSQTEKKSWIGFSSGSTSPTGSPFAIG